MSRIPVSSEYFILQCSFETEKEAYNALQNQARVFKSIYQDCRTFTAELYLSHVDGDVVERVNVRKGLVGRPKYEFQRKKRTRKKMYTDYHIHIIIVGLYAATVAKKFCERMNVSYFRRHPQTTLIEPFRKDKVEGDVRYLVTYCRKQALKYRTEGEKKSLESFDKNTPLSEEQTKRVKNYIYKKKAKKRPYTPTNTENFKQAQV